MAWLILLGAFSAWGLLCALWAALGWLLDGGVPEIILVCPEKVHPETLLPRICWLRGLGLLHGQIRVVYETLAPEEAEILKKKYADIDFCSRADAVSRLGTERTS